MALQVNYELNDVVYNDIYMKITKIRSSLVDYEMFEVEEDSNGKPFEKLNWKTECESSATVYVWETKKARENRAMSLHWFNFDFKYDLTSKLNIYQQAYKALKVLDKFSGAVDV